jgi:hypothetical protein
VAFSIKKSRLFSITACFHPELLAKPCFGWVVCGAGQVCKGGTLADYVVVTEAAVALKPAAILFDQAAALQTVDQLAAVGQGYKNCLMGPWVWAYLPSN